MKHRSELRARWSNAVPALDGDYKHWWLEGDGGLLIATDSLSELLDTIEKYYSRNMNQVVKRARAGADGDLVADEKRQFVVVNWKQDESLGWRDET